MGFLNFLKDSLKKFQEDYKRNYERMNNNLFPPQTKKELPEQIIIHTEEKKTSIGSAAGRTR